MLIYIVDDEIQVSEILAEEIADQLKAKTLCFTSLDECIDAIDQEAPDLILCDVMMPTGSGLRLTEELKKRSLNTPHIYITGMIDKLPPKQNVYMLRKPIKIPTLIEKIKNIIVD